MLNIIQNNPYRLLGIYSNSSTKERVANHNRLKAFLKVGKAVPFTLDLPALLPTIIRSTEIITEADAKLTLPNEQLWYALFWFAKVTPLDDVAMNHLMAGNINEAIFIWERKDNASSLQNRIVCALIQSNYTEAFACANKLYSSYITDFAHIILGKCHTVDIGELEYHFLDELCSTVGTKNIFPYLQNSDWKQYVGNKTIKPLIETLQSAVDTAKASKGKGITARYNAGIKLMNETKEALIQLKTLLSSTDLQYQMIVDKLGLEILQCGIDYYNDSEAADAAHKAMKLQAYALSVVIGKMAKERCKENVDILQNIIDNLPPAEVFAEDRAIKEELRKFCQLPDKISHAVTLLNNAKPHLQAIKKKLGSTNTYYLKISTQVVGNALHNVIEEVNYAQRNDDNISGIHPEQNEAISALLRLPTIKRALESAWNATKIMDTFDMESDFKINRYNQNRSILKKMCEQMDIPIYVPRQPILMPNPPVTDSSSSSNGNSTDSTSSSTGCILSFVAGVIGAMIGNGIAGAGGAVLGMISGIIVGTIIENLFEKNN